MSAWPIEELWFRPAVTLLLALALPWASGRVLIGLLGGPGSADGEASRTALLAVRAERVLDACFIGLLGWTALPRALADQTWTRVAFALLAVVLMAVSSFAFVRRLGNAAKSMDMAVGAAGSEARVALTAALVVGLSLPLVAVLVERGTRIRSGDIARTSADQARRRLRIDPRDGAAMLATAWAAADENDLERAEERIAEAERMGAPAPEIEEARAELAARRDDCEAAREHFDRALSLRAASAFERGELELGGFNLPRSMITHCEGSDEE